MTDDDATPEPDEASRAAGGADGANPADVREHEPDGQYSDQQRSLGRTRGAKDAIIAVFVAALLAVVFAGDSLERAAESMPEGVARDVVAAIGKPAGAIAGALPFAAAADGIAGWFGAEDDPKTSAKVVSPKAAPASTAGSSRPASDISADDFDRRSVDADGPAPKLTTVLVTGDSMAQPLDSRLARSLAGSGVKVTRDARLGSAISKPEPVDWLELAPQQIKDSPAQVVVMLLGANEGFPLPGPGSGDAQCCTADWAAAYAARVQAISTAWLEGGADQVLWLTLPAPKDARRQPISRAVNAAVRVGLGGFGSAATVLDTDEYFTPGGQYRASIEVDGREELVRSEDGIHLSEQGAEQAAELVERELRGLYALGG